MMPLCHLFSMLLIKAKKLYNQQRDKTSKSESYSDISTQFSVTHDEVLWFQYYIKHGD